eukprot:3106353-Amphidinium_carterae.2
MRPIHGSGDGLCTHVVPRSIRTCTSTDVEAHEGSAIKARARDRPTQQADEFPNLDLRETVSPVLAPPVFWMSLLQHPIAAHKAVSHVWRWVVLRLFARE